MKKVLFLDIDGVVNCQNTKQRHRGFIGIDPYMAFLVARIVEATQCDVVLSSSWRNSPDDSKEEVRKQVVNFVDVTVDSWYVRETQHHSTRGEEIQEWLDRHPEVEKYAILDDDSDMLDSQLPNFFKTTWLNGITPEIAEAVIAHLGREVEEETLLRRCPKCKKEFVPAEDCKNYTTGEWDGHSYKPGCKHISSKFRITCA